jgi:molybdopterin converting factor small subunit
MPINVKLYATFRRFAPPETGLGESFSLDIENKNISEVIDLLKIPIEKGVIVMVNGIRITDLNHLVQDNDLIVIFPLLGGG